MVCPTSPLSSLPIGRYQKNFSVKTKIRAALTAIVTFLKRAIKQGSNLGIHEHVHGTTKRRYHDHPTRAKPNCTKGESLHCARTARYF